MRSTDPHDGERRAPVARFAGLALAAVIGAASIAAPLAASAEEAAPEGVVEVAAAPETAADGTDPDATAETPLAGEELETPAAGAGQAADAQAAPAEDEEQAQAEEQVPAEQPAAEASGAAPAPAAFAADEPAEFAPNRAPVAGDDHWQMLQDTTLTVSDPGVNANDLDPDGDYFFANQSTPPAVGTLEWTDTVDGEFRYTPPAGFTGTVTFTYRLLDDHGDEDLQSEWATVTIEVLPTGSDPALAPVAGDDTYLYTPGTPLYIAAYQGLLANDELDDAPVTSLGFPFGAGKIGNGKVQLLDGGAFLADAGDALAQTFQLTYRVCNAIGCDDATLWLYPADAGVEPSGPDAIPEAPVAVPDVYGVVQDTPITVSAAEGLLANDADVELGQPGELLEAIIDTTGLKGTLTNTSTDGSFVYTPPAGFTGTDTFHYYANDQHAYASPSVVVELQVGDGSVNHRPIAVDDHYVVQADEMRYLPAPGVLANDVDPDGDALEFNNLGTKGLGAFGQFQGGWMTYTPPAGFVGTTTWSYFPRDEHGLVSLEPATMTFEVVPSDGAVNHAPISVVDAYLVEAGQTLTVPGPGVLANDFDADGDPLSVLMGYGAYDGEAAVAVDGGFSYTAPVGYSGTDWIEFTVTDGASITSGRAMVVVHEAGAEPTFGTEDAYFPVKDEPFSVDAPGVLANDHVPAGATGEATPLTAKKTDHGVVTLQADGSFVYTPDAGFVGKDTFRYEFHSGDTWEYPIVVLTVLEEAPVTGQPGEGEPGEGEPGDGGPGEGEPGDGEGPVEPGRPSETGGPAEPAADSATTASSDAGRGSSLAETGSDAAGAAAVSAIAVLLGLLGMVGARRRRRALR